MSDTEVKFQPPDQEIFNSESSPDDPPRTGKRSFKRRNRVGVPAFEGDPESKTVLLFDESNPRNLINLVSERTKEAILKLVKRRPHVFFLDDRNFRKHAKPDALVSRLRLAFWDEYNRAQDRNAKMVVGNICRGVCSEDYYHEVILKVPERLAWMIYPPKDYIYAMREMLDLGLDEWREILTLPIKDKKGKIDYKLLTSKVKIVQLLDLRVKGAIIQKLQVSQKNLNVNVDAPCLPDEMSLEELESLERKITAVSEQAGLIPGGSKVMTMSGRRVAVREHELEEPVEGYIDVMASNSLEEEGEDDTED